MTQIERGLTVVDVDGKQAEQELDKLKKRVGDVRSELRMLRKTKADPKLIKQLEKEYAGLRKEMRKTKKSTIDVKKVMDNLSGTSARDLERAYRKVRAQRKGMARDNKEYNSVIAVEKRLKREVDKANMSFRQQRSLISRVGDGFNKYFGMITAGAATAAGAIMGIRKAVDNANMREKVRDDLQAITGLVDTEVDALVKAAAQMSQSTVDGGVRITQSADDIVNAYKKMGSQRPDLLKNGQALRDVTKDAIILSEAANGELEPSVKSLAAVMNQFNEPASESRNIINSIAAGSQAGAGDIQYIGTAMEKAGTTANLMNQSYQETIGLIETVAPYYTRAEMAGNSLDKVMLKLKANNIGYVSGVFDMNDAIDELRQEFENGRTAADIFGVEHAKMGELLVANQDAFNTFTEKVTGSNKAIEQATINTDNNASKLAQAKNRIHEVSVELGEKLQPAMTHIVSKGSLMLKVLGSLVDFFTKNGAVIIKVVAAYGTYLVVSKAINLWNNKIKDSVLTLTKNFKKYISSLRSASSAQMKLNQAQKANLWGAIASVVALAVVQLVKFVKQQREVKKAVSDTRAELLQQKTDMNDLFNTLEKAPKSSDAYKSAMKRLNDEYGQYLEHQVTEQTSIAELTRLRKLATEALHDEMIGQLQQRLNTKNLDFYEKLSKRQSTAVDKLMKDNFSKEQAEALVKGYTQYEMDVFKGIDKPGHWWDRLDFDFDESKLSSVMFDLQKVGVAVTDLNNRTSETQDTMSLFKESLASDVPDAQWIADLPDTIAEFSSEQQANFRHLAVQYQSLVNKTKNEAEAQRLINDYVSKRQKLIQQFAPDDDSSNPTPDAVPGDDSGVSDDTSGDDEKLLANARKFRDDIYKIKLSGYDREIMLAGQKYDRLLEENQLYIDYYEEQDRLGFDGAQEQLEEYLQLERDLYDAHGAEVAGINDKYRKKENQERQKEFQKQKQEVQRKYDLYTSLAQDMGAAFGEAMAKQEDRGQEFLKSSLSIMLKFLKQYLQVQIAKVTIGSLSSPESIASAGIAGIAKAAALTAALEGAYQFAASKIEQWDTGKYPVVGANDGRSYNAGFIGRPQTGIYSSPSLGLFNEDPSRPEMVIDSDTTESLRFNFPHVIDTIYRVAGKQFDSGKYPDQATPSQDSVNHMDELISLIRETRDINARLSDQINSGLGVNYDKLKDAESEIDNIHSKSSG